jgi:hypothetical protein
MRRPPGLAISSQFGVGPAPRNALPLPRRRAALWTGVPDRRNAWSAVQVLTVDQEGRRQLHRELQSAKRDRTQVTDRMQRLRGNRGLTLDLKKDVPAYKGLDDPAS